MLIRYFLKLILTNHIFCSNIALQISIAETAIVFSGKRRLSVCFLLPTVLLEYLNGHS